MEILVVILLSGLVFAGLKLRKQDKYKKQQYTSTYNTRKELKTHQHRKTGNTDDKPENTIPLGEQLLLNELCHNFNLLGQEAVIWHGLKYRFKKSFRQVDFLVLCKKGLFALESKYWKGVSFIFDGDVVSLFEGTMYNDFGQARKEDRKTKKDGKFIVFNAKLNEEKGAILLKTYQNPVVQVRSYARDLSQFLEDNNIKNKNIKSVVVFATNDESELRYNRKPLVMIKKIGKYTSILLDNQLNDYFENNPIVLAEEELEQIKSIVENNLSFHQRIDKTNFARMGN